MYLKNKCGGFTLKSVRSMFLSFLRALIAACVVEVFLLKSDYDYFTKLEVTALKSLVGLERYTKSESVCVLFQIDSYTQYMYRMKVRFYFRLLYSKPGSLPLFYYHRDYELFENGYKKMFSEEITNIFNTINSSINLNPQSKQILRLTKTDIHVAGLLSMSQLRCI